MLFEPSRHFEQGAVAQLLDPGLPGLEKVCRDLFIRSVKEATKFFFEPPDSDRLQLALAERLQMFLLFLAQRLGRAQPEVTGLLEPFITRAGEAFMLLAARLVECRARDARSDGSGRRPVRLRAIAAARPSRRAATYQAKPL